MIILSRDRHAHIALFTVIEINPYSIALATDSTVITVVGWFVRGVVPELTFVAIVP